MPYEITIDMGKPYTENAETLDDVKKVLTDLYHNHIKDKDDYPHCEIIIMDSDGRDCTESQVIEEMFAEIIDSETDTEKLPRKQNEFCSEDDGTPCEHKKDGTCPRKCEYFHPIEDEPGLSGDKPYLPRSGDIDEAERQDNQRATEPTIGYQITLEIDAGNCVIKEDEKENIHTEITKILANRGITLRTFRIIP